MKTTHSASIIASLIALGLFAAAPVHAGIVPGVVPTSGLSENIELNFDGFTYGDSNTRFTASEWTTRTIRPGKQKSEYVPVYDGQAGGVSFQTWNPATWSLGSFASYCVELAQTTAGSWDWATYTLGSFSTTVASGLARLYQVASASTAFSTANGSAAFQAAVWEIVNETDTKYDLAEGSFIGDFWSLSRKGGWIEDEKITGQANSWLAQVNTFSGSERYKAQKYVNAYYQDQLVITSLPLAVTSVPEPETYALLLAGLGLMGAVARRRRAR